MNPAAPLRDEHIQKQPGISWEGWSGSWVDTPGLLGSHPERMV